VLSATKTDTKVTFADFSYNCFRNVQIIVKHTHTYTERTILLKDLKFCCIQIWMQKIILLGHQNNVVGTLKILSSAAKNFDSLVTSLNFLHNYFDGSTKLLF